MGPTPGAWSEAPHPLPAPKGVKGLEWDEQRVPMLEMGQAGERAG